MNSIRNKLLLAGTIVALGAGSLSTAGIAQASHGSDDPARHDVRDDHGVRHAHHARAARDDRGGRHDDGPNHG